MAAKRDWYEVLGVPRDASKQEIKKAYFALAKKYHPDTSKEADAVRKFQEASEAWEILGDDEKRAAYDQFGHAAEEMGGGPGGGGERMDPFEAFRQAFGQQGGFSSHPQAHDLEDLLDDFFGEATGRGRRKRGPRRGPDVQLGLRLSFMEAAKGVEGKEIEWFEITRDGRRGDKQRTTTDVPGGVDTGMSIRIAGKGGRGDPGAPRGDLYLQVEVAKDDYFERDGPDVHVTVDLDLVKAALGSTVKVLTLDGLVDLNVPPGTQPDAKFRLKARGLPIPNRRDQRGHQYVHVNVRVPTNLTPHQRRLLEAFYDESGSAESNKDNNNNSNATGGDSDERTESAWRRLKRYFTGEQQAQENNNSKKASA